MAIEHILSPDRLNLKLSPLSSGVALQRSA
jgi:hypothetical protein